MLDALKQLGADYRCVDLCEWFPWHRALDIEYGEFPSAEEGGILVIHMNPPEFLLALFFLRKFNLRNKRIVGYWVWELERIPDTWARHLRFVDEIWVPSEFVARAIRRRTQIPVHVVPHPVPIPAAGRVNAMPDRAAFGIRDSVTVFLTLFDARSCAARKNPVGAIRAFRSAFGQARDVLLVIKGGNLDQFPEVKAALFREIHNAENIRLFAWTFSGSELASLLACVDVIVSLHRSEGFGLVLAEAMLIGKPVVATEWSGNLDFMNRKNSVLIGYQLVPLDDPQKIYRMLGEVWAEPNIEEAAKAMRSLHADGEYRRRVGAAARRDASAYFGLEHYRSILSERMDCRIGDENLGRKSMGSRSRP